MARADKRIQRWLNNPPTDAPVEEVEAILKHYFPGKLKTKTGSHRVVRDERLAPYPGFAPFGELSIPVK